MRWLTASAVIILVLELVGRALSAMSIVNMTRMAQYFLNGFPRVLCIETRLPTQPFLQFLGLQSFGGVTGISPWVVTGQGSVLATQYDGANPGFLAYTELGQAAVNIGLGSPYNVETRQVQSTFAIEGLQLTSNSVDVKGIYLWYRGATLTELRLG